MISFLMSLLFKGLDRQTNLGLILEQRLQGFFTQTLITDAKEHWNYKNVTVLSRLANDKKYLYEKKNGSFTA